jgi:hypothetical protein
MFKGWDFSFVDTRGRSRDVILGWRTRALSCSNIHSVDSILVTILYYVKLRKDILAINMYGP